ncbi:PH domain-containing protein [Bacillus halotolerans]|uniref:PH domain-containing protein n=1 Tax=Bacillus halotolerans TaxID=260554 RepID=UPI00215543B3|nr:PH domain-containing protein [Bacillus halotolerans]MCR6598844.1 PH domain-containing protein [Bacillus halotolerans]
MIGVKVKKSKENLVINWQLSKIEIPIKEINDVFLDPNYGGEEKSAVRIGLPYGSTDRVVIKTANNTYILFTTNAASIMNKIVNA